MTLDDAIFVAGKLIIECELLRERVRLLENALNASRLPSPAAADTPGSPERREHEQQHS